MTGYELNLVTVGEEAGKAYYAWQVAMTSRDVFARYPVMGLIIGA